MKGSKEESYLGRLLNRTEGSQIHNKCNYENVMKIMAHRKPLISMVYIVGNIKKQKYDFEISLTTNNFNKEGYRLWQSQNNSTMINEDYWTTY